jgi:hypothetical protein
MGENLPQICKNKARTLTAVLAWAPAMTPDIHTIPANGHAFVTQAGPLLVTAWASGRQAQPAAGSDYAVPGQVRALWKLAQLTPDPPGRPRQPRQLPELAVSDHTAGGNDRQRCIQCQLSSVR